MDLLIEVSQLAKLIDTPVVDERNHERVCLYLLRSADFIRSQPTPFSLLSRICYHRRRSPYLTPTLFSVNSDIDELVTLYHVAYSIYKRLNKFTDALRVAIKVDKAEYIDALFADEAGAPELEKKQMALLLGRHRSQHVLADSVSVVVLHYVPTDWEGSQCETAPVYRL